MSPPAGESAQGRGTITNPAAPTIPDLSATCCSTSGTSRPSRSARTAPYLLLQGHQQIGAGIRHVAADNYQFRIEHVKQSGDAPRASLPMALETIDWHSSSPSLAAWKIVRQVANWGCSRNSWVSVEAAAAMHRRPGFAFDGARREDRFQATAIAADAGRAVGFDGHVAQVAGHTGMAAQQLAVGQNGAAHAHSQSQHKHVLHARAPRPRPSRRPGPRGRRYRRTPARRPAGPPGR